MALIFFLSSIGDLGPAPAGTSDKFWHFFAYGVLGALVLVALADGRPAGVTWRRAAAAVVFATLYGVSDEFHQSFVPGRTSDVMDVVADFVGATSAVMLAGLVIAARAWGILKASSHPSDPL